MSLIDPDYACQAHIKVDNEIGSPGVATSFLFVSWLTIILASILASHELKIAIKRFKTWLANRKRTKLKARARSSSQSSPSEPVIPTQDGDPETITNHGSAKSHHKGTTADLPPKLHKLIQLLGHICDIQVVTALAIIVAGLAQWTRISYYHEVLVTQYFQLTLDSFWAARINYMDFYKIDHVHSGLSPPSRSPSNSHDDLSRNETAAERRSLEASYYDDRQTHLQVRRAAVLAACILAVIWQFRLYFRENVGPQHWNDGPGGPCYRYLDRSNPTAVLVVRTTGLIVFCFALGVTLLGFPWAGRLHGLYERGRSAVMGWARRRFMSSLGRYDGLRMRKTRMSMQISGQEKDGESTRQSTINAEGSPTATGHLIEWVLAMLMLTINALVLLVVFLLCQWLAIWSYGDGFYPLLWFCYFCFNVWNTVSVISLLILNHPLVDHEEMDWGFGQVLPMVLLLAIVFVTVDVFSRPEPRPISRPVVNAGQGRGEGE